ncbi:MAG: GDSL-type esterase/lipase family protein [Terriglobia bacterium]|jgi:lysophospholipase L1-like esterase
MKRRNFLQSAPATLLGATSTLAMGRDRLNAGQEQTAEPRSALVKPGDFKKEPFKRLVILGESTVEDGLFLEHKEDRYADVLVRLINTCQEHPIEYFNKGIGANAISPRSPGYAQSRKPSAIERYKTDVIDIKPDLFILAYGLNDMRAGMPLLDFREDMATIIRDVQKACSPVTLLTTVYYMTGWKSYPPYNKGSVGLALKYNDCIRKLATEFGCILADVWSAEGGADWLIHCDGVHANKVGSQVIAGRIFEALAQHASGLTNWTFELNQNTDWTRINLVKRSEAGDPFRKTW